MKCQSLFSGKNISLLSPEFAHKMVKVVKIKVPFGIVADIVFCFC